MACLRKTQQPIDYLLFESVFLSLFYRGGALNKACPIPPLFIILDTEVTGFKASFMHDHLSEGRQRLSYKSRFQTAQEWERKYPTLGKPESPLILTKGIGLAIQCYFGQFLGTQLWAEHLSEVSTWELWEYPSVVGFVSFTQ